MDPERWKQIDDLLQSALRLTPDRRDGVSARGMLSATRLWSKKFDLC